jgi:hypothetical protein
MTDHMSQWVGAFLAEWCRLSEGLAEPEQLKELANEIYASYGKRDPAEVAADMWGGGAGADRAVS